MRFLSPLVALTMLAPFGAAQDAGPSLTPLYSFHGPDGSFPESGLLIAPKSGDLYSATVQGGSAKRGTVFVLKPPAVPGDAWTETVLYNFGGTGMPWTPSGLTFGKGGRLYGTAAGGGVFNSGAVFKLTPAAGGTWTETTLFNFGAARGDGTQPIGALVLGGNGALFGTTAQGGNAGGGTIFALRPPAGGGSEWREAILYNFGQDSDANGPHAGVIMDKNGILYGTACCGGSANHGAVFQLAPPAHSGDPWKETVLHSFQGGSDGSTPLAGLLMGKNGTLYGTTKSGGAANLGTVFALAPPTEAGGKWTETVLYSFMGGSDGAYPLAPLLKSINGALCGATSRGGAAGLGTLFKLVPAAGGGTWTETVLESFGTNNGAVPVAALAQAQSGAIYGTTEFGGTAGFGTVFKLVP